MIASSKYGVARLVLVAEPVDPLLSLVEGDVLAGAEQALDEPFREDVHDGGHLREVLGVQDDAQGRPGLTLGEEAAAVHQGALAEDVQVARLVHDLREQEELRLVVGGVDPGQPLAWGVAGDELDLREEGAELAHRPLYIVRQRLDGLPGDVRGGRPLALDRLLVEKAGVLRPDVRLVGVIDAGARGVLAGARVTWEEGGGLRALGHLAARLDLVERQAAPPRQHLLDLPGVFRPEPAQVELEVLFGSVKLFENIGTNRHGPPSRITRCESVCSESNSRL